MASQHTIAIPSEAHTTGHISWLRAAVLGANDGIVSTASLIVGVAAAATSHENILLTGIAGLVGGAMSMAAGEYVSVSSQADTEDANLAIEKNELKNNFAFEHDELAQIYVGRGVEPLLAKEVAKQLMEHDALGSHARDELGITEAFSARPIQAACASGAAFSVGAALPLAIAWISGRAMIVPAVSIASIVFLLVLGILSSWVGGANVWKGALRVCFWGALAMAATALIGHVFGTVIS